MNRFTIDIPGRNKYEHREVLYVELRLNKDENINKYFNFVVNKHNSFIPKSGGAIAENFIITTPNRVSFMGLSYNKDIEGWRRKIIAGTEELDLKTASINELEFIISDGITLNLVDCSYEKYGFYDENKKLVNKRTPIELDEIFTEEELT